MAAEGDSKPADLEAVKIRDSLDGELERMGEDGSEVSADKAPPVVETKAVESESELPISNDVVSRYLNVGGNFYTGVDVTSEDAVRKREERAKRFGIQDEPTQASLEQDSDEVKLDVTMLEARSKRFGTELLLAEGQPIKFVKSLPPIPLGKIRPEAVHLHGLDEMSTEDVFEFFSLFGPRNIEWINDKSCNAVWEDEISARRALVGLGHRPLSVMGDQDTQDKAEEREPEQNVQGQDNKSESASGTEELARDEKGEEGEEKRKSWREQERGDEEETSSVRWWLASPHSSSKQLLVRQATTGDMKKRGAAQESLYYRKYGNPNKPLRAEPMDLRDRLGRKRPSDQVGEEQVQAEEEGEMEVDTSPDPLASLAKRPKPMHADRDEEDEYEEDRHCGRNDGGEGGEGELGSAGGEVVGTTKGSDADLRKLLKKKRKRRDLQLRLGHCPRLVEEHQ